LLTVQQLNPATPVSASDFKRVSFDAGSKVYYLTASLLDQLIARGAVYPRRVILGGEFIGRSDLVTLKQLNSTQVSVALNLSPSKSLGPGDSADLWATTSNKGAEPMQISVDAQVVEISAPTSSFGGSSKAEAELLVSQNELPGILGAVADGSQLALVPTTSSSISQTR